MESLFHFRRTLPPVKEDFESWEDDPSPAAAVDNDTCPNCFNVDCLYTTDLVTCKECGHIVARPFDNTAEYRYFSNEDRGGDPTRELWSSCHVSCSQISFLEYRSL